MNLGELIESFRKLADDNASPPLWSDEEITRYVNEAERDAVERGFLIEDDETAEICEIAVEADTAIYNLDPRVLKITKAKLDLQHRLLDPTEKSVLDLRLMATWESNPGTPFAYIDRQSSIRLVWVPIADDTLRLTVYRLPLADMDGPDDEPEIRAELHYQLLDGMLARGYLKNDSETYNPAKSAEHEARFTQHFGQKIDANVRRKQRSNRSNVVRMNSF